MYLIFSIILPKNKDKDKYKYKIKDLNTLIDLKNKINIIYLLLLQNLAFIIKKLI